MARDNAKKGDQPPAVTGGKDQHAKSHGAKRAAKPIADDQHHASKAHGQPARVDTSLPATREELLELHAAARGRRAAAALDSAEFRQAVDEIGRIEVRVAAIERDQVPPKG